MVQIKRGLFSSGDTHTIGTSYADVVMTGEQDFGFDSKLPLGQHFSIRSVVFTIAAESATYDGYIEFYLKMTSETSSRSALFIAPINTVDGLSARYDFNPPLSVQIDPTTDWAAAHGQEVANTVRLCCRSEIGNIDISRTELHWEQVG